MKTKAYLTLLLAVCTSAFAQDKASSGMVMNGGTVMTEASLTIAKNVCASKPDADVWVFNRLEWKQFNCSQLGAVFAIDTENKFDKLIPLMQSLEDDSDAKKPATSNPQGGQQ